MKLLLLLLITMSYSLLVTCILGFKCHMIWATPSEFVTYRLCEQRRFRRACASAQSRQNLRCSLIQTVSQEEPSDRKPDPCPLWMAGHAQLKFVMTECSKTQIRLTGLILWKESSNCAPLIWNFCIVQQDVNEMLKIKIYMQFVLLRRKQKMLCLL